jgi:hypothetical protein
VAGADHPSLLPTCATVLTWRFDPEKAAAGIERLRAEYRKLLENGIDEAMVKHETDRLLAPTNPQSGLVARIATDNLAVALPGLLTPPPEYAKPT